MSIPSIQEYALNDPAFQVNNRVTWQPDNQRALLLIHDMQQYFLDLLPPQLRTQVVHNCQRLLKYARAHSIPVVYTAQCGDMSKRERGLLADIWGPGMRRIESHTSITPALSPTAKEYVLDKWRYSAFFSTPLDDIFRHSGRDQIVVCGIYAHIGVMSTAVDAFSRDIEVFLVKDAIADFSQAAHAQALTLAAESCAKVLAVDEVCV